MVLIGYGVVEFMVYGVVDLVGKMLGEVGFWECDIMVFIFYCGVSVILNLCKYVVFEVDDWFFCFGKFDEMCLMVLEWCCWWVKVCCLFC